MFSEQLQNPTRKQFQRETGNNAITKFKHHVKQYASITILHCLLHTPQFEMARLQVAGVEDGLPVRTTAANILKSHRQSTKSDHSMHKLDKG